MKILKFFLVTFSTMAFAQNTPSVEKSIFGAQTGFFGFWAYNESKLTNEIALRSEIGLDFGFSSNGSGTTTALIPNLRVEPRWYYNLEKRVTKGRNITNNSGNFLALNINYNPDWFFISNRDNIGVISTIAIIPKWGIKRTVGNHFTYETGIGIGKFFVLNNFEVDNTTAVDLHLRIGYTF